MDNYDELRRRFLVRLLSCGFFAGGTLGTRIPAWAMGSIPDELPAGRSIYRLSGDVRVDDRKADLDTRITPRSVIETGSRGNIIFAVGKDAFILRSDSRLEMNGGDAIITGLRLVTGKLLSVFGKRKPVERLGMKTVVATIGIRGTGIYIESEPDRSYVCTCYGTTNIASLTDEQSRETVITEHHDAPRYVLADAPAGDKIQPAPFINHTDEELELIESLVGRTVPFAFTGGYDSLRNPRY